MKLRKLFESILNEIGDYASFGGNIRYYISDSKGKISFKIDDLSYNIDLDLIYKYTEEGFIINRLFVSFYTKTNNKPNYELTNKNNMLKVMGTIVNSIEQWLLEFKKKYYLKKIIIYEIAFKPHYREDEARLNNARSKIYQYYINKFCKKYNSSPSFKNDIIIVLAKLNPPIILNNDSK